MISYKANTSTLKKKSVELITQISCQTARSTINLYLNLEENISNCSQADTFKQICFVFFWLGYTDKTSHFRIYSIFVAKAVRKYWRLFHPDAGFLMASFTGPLTQRMCLISMYELLCAKPAMWLCSFPIACRCISEQRPDLCKCHFISLRAKA